jgi:predicted transcriptional regulator of viral defense system
MNKKRNKPISNNELAGTDKEILSTLSRASAGGLISIELASKALKCSSLSAARLLSRLERKGWIKRAMRGWYYILPLEATKKAGGVADDPWVIASVLFNPCYVGGWSAAEYWELTEQLFRSTLIVSAWNARAKTNNVLGNEYRIIRVSKTRIDNKAGLVPIWRGNNRVLISDRERTIVDGLLNPELIGGFRHLADIFKDYISSPNRSYEKLIGTAKEMNKGAIFKRLGFLIERFDPKAGNHLATLQKNLSLGLIKLDPDINSKGKVNKAWGVWENVTL